MKNNEHDQEELEFEISEDLSEEILKKLGVKLPEPNDLTAAMIEHIERMGNRKIYLYDDVKPESILSVIYQIHILEKKDPTKDIELIISSNGGYVVDCLALIDVMDMSPCDFKVLVLGMAASAACLIASNGTPGKRYAGKNAEFMFHEVRQMIPEIKYSEIKYYLNDLKRTQKKFNKIFGHNTEKTEKEIQQAFYGVANDRYMTATEARSFGIIDHVEMGKRVRK